VTNLAQRGVVIHTRELPSLSIGRINALFPKMGEYPQVIKQRSTFSHEDFVFMLPGETCASTRCWPKLRPFSHEDFVFMLPGKS
jgi:hypothetical protein